MVVDLGELASDCATEEDLHSMSKSLHDALATVGFAYWTNTPLSLSHEYVFGVAKEFFDLREHQLWALPRKLSNAQTATLTEGAVFFASCPPILQPAN